MKSNDPHKKMNKFSPDVWSGGKSTRIAGVGSDQGQARKKPKMDGSKHSVRRLLCHSKCEPAQNMDELPLERDNEAVLQALA